MVVFFSAFYDDDFYLIDNLKDIARHYIMGWFLLDVLAIIPFDQFNLTTGMDRPTHMNSMIRIAKVGRMQKLVKLTRLIRIIKVVKNKNKLLFQQVRDLFG